MICYVCKKEIKENEESLSIGKNLYRHKRCFPGQPKNLDGTLLVVKYVEQKIEEPKIKKGRGRPKGSKNKEK